MDQKRNVKNVQWIKLSVKMGLLPQNKDIGEMKPTLGIISFTIASQILNVCKQIYNFRSNDKCRSGSSGYLCGHCEKGGMIGDNMACEKCSSVVSEVIKLSIFLIIFIVNFVLTSSSKLKIPEEAHAKIVMS
jgi:hypothetical protein